MDVLKAYAEQNGIANSAPADLIKDPRIISLIEHEVDQCTRDLSQYEKVKAVLLLDREMTVENGELTPTLKVKRRVVVDKHKKLIDRLYAEKEASFTASQS
jgi:long-chain acyl-CoA synthetase